MKCLSVLIITLLVSLNAFSQQGTISVKGTISDADGQPIPYASVRVKGTDKITYSGENGDYTLQQIPEGEQVLVIAYAGFTSIEKEIFVDDNPLILNFQLEEDHKLLEQVIVSASRQKETIGETPASVTIIDAEEIKNQMAVSPNIGNVIGYSVPGLALGTNSTSSTGQTLRGRNVLVMVDGIPQSTPLRAGGRDVRTIDPSVIERIEVVKGATAIYGNGADGGLINYITKKPSSNKAFNAITTVSGNGMAVHADNTLGGRFSQQFSGKVKDFEYVLNGMYERTGVYKDGEGRLNSPVYGLGQSDIYNGFAKLKYTINAKNSIEAMYNYFSSRQNSDYIAQVGEYGQSPTTGVEGNRQGVAEGTRYNHNAYLKYISRDIVGATDLFVDLYAQDFWTIYGFSTFFKDGGQSSIKSKKKGARLGANVPFVLSNAVKGDVTIGLDLLNDVTSQVLVDGRDWVPEMDMKNLAPYLQIKSYLSQYWVFKGGVRLENININVNDYTTIVDAQGRGGVAVQGGELDFSALTFNTGLRFTRYKTFTPFVSFSQGFSMIDLGRTLRSASENTLAKIQTEPVIVSNYEVGFSSNINNKFTFSGAYYISTSNLGSTLTEQDGIFVQQRAPEKVQGFEVVADVYPIDKLSFGASFSYVEGKADINENDKYDDPEDVYLSGIRIAPSKATAYVRYQPFNRLNVGLQWVYSGERDRFDANEEGIYAWGEGPVNSFHLLNLNAGYQPTAKIKLFLGVENLLNNTYYLPKAQFYAQDEDYTTANGLRYNLGLSYTF